jgi:6-phosphogluconate dehydrogenase
MELGMTGLGRMGSNMVRRLLKGGHSCAVYNRSPKSVQELVQVQAIGTSAMRFAFGGHLEKVGGEKASA